MSSRDATALVRKKLIEAKECTWECTTTAEAGFNGLESAADDSELSASASSLNDSVKQKMSRNSHTRDFRPKAFTMLHLLQTQQQS